MPMCGYHRLLCMTDEDEVQRIEAVLHDEGWADHTSLARELRGWARLAEEVNAYTGTVDDYTNDLCSRDYLEVMEAPASPGLRNASTNKSPDRLLVPKGHARRH